MKTGVCGVPGGTRTAGHPGPASQPTTRRITAADRSTDTANRSTVQGHALACTRRRKSAYSRRLKTSPGWAGCFESRITTAPAILSTRMQPPDPLHMKLNSGQSFFSPVIFLSLHLVASPGFPRTRTPSLNQSSIGTSPPKEKRNLSGDWSPSRFRSMTSEAPIPPDWTRRP